MAKILSDPVHEHDFQKLNERQVFCRTCGDIKTAPPATAYHYYYGYCPACGGHHTSAPWHPPYTVWSSAPPNTSWSSSSGQSMTISAGYQASSTAKLTDG